MLPTIETFAKPAPGAAISWAGSEEPTFAVPFPGWTLVGTFGAGPDSVVFVGGRVDMTGGSVGATLFARFDRQRGCVAQRLEVGHLRAEFAAVSRDGGTVFASGEGGILVVDVASLRLVRRIELYRPADDGGTTTSWEEWDGQKPRSYTLEDGGRWRRAAAAGWHNLKVHFGFQLGETADGLVAFVDRWPQPFSAPAEEKRQCLHVIDWRRGTVRTETFRDGAAPTSLDRVDATADLLHVTRRQVGLFRASPPPDVARAGPFACPEPTEHALVLHQWPLLDRGVAPRTIAVRTAKAEAWTLAFGRSRHRMPQGMPGTPENAFNHPSPTAEVEAPAFWQTAAKAFLPHVYEDPRDGLVWLAFADDHIRSLDEAGRLGPLIALGGKPNVPSDQPYGLDHCPSLSFQGADLIVVRVLGENWPVKMARYVFRAADMAGRTGPLTLMPARPGPLPGSHAKAFADFVRHSRRDRFSLPDWSRDSVAAALEAQRAAVAAGLPDLVDPEEDRLAFHYRVAGKPVKEAAFFRRIAKDAIPVGPELRALLLAYVDQLGAGGEGVQPWQDPDEAVGGLGPALHALALLDPDSLDVLHAYLETRDGEHEGYALDVVVPAFFERHGWRDAAAVRFGIYATLNRFWGGRHPPHGFEGMSDAMARHLTPAEAAEAVLREAGHFGGKPDWGYDAAAYRAAFRTLLDRASPFDAAVLDALAEEAPSSAGP